MNCTGIFVSVEKSAQVFAVGGNDVLIPVERLLFVARPCVGAIVIAVYIDARTILLPAAVLHLYNSACAPTIQPVSCALDDPYVNECAQRHKNSHQNKRCN